MGEENDSNEKAIVKLPHLLPWTMGVQCDHCGARYDELAETRQFVKFGHTDHICPECENRSATFSSIIAD
jgi:hypothetical protein